MCALIARRRAIETRERTAALVTIAHEVIARYRAEKTRRGLLDYDDLIDKALASARRAARPMGALQARSRHRPRADRRGAGHQRPSNGRSCGASPPSSSPARARARSTRSVFAVGDEKQSIFSFQGAEPKQFGQMQRHFARSVRPGRNALRGSEVPVLVPLRAARAAGGRQRVQPRAGLRGADRGRRAGPCTRRCARTRRASSSCGR